MSVTPICEACWLEIPAQREHCCARCGEDLFQPVPLNDQDYCRACRLAPPAFVRAVSHAVYEGSMRSLLHALKYDRLAPAAGRLGEMLASAIAQMAPGTADAAPSDLLVVPVPLHRSRMSARGFNQARILAVAALRALKQSHPAWNLELSAAPLVRKRATESLSGLTPRQRRINLRGAFFVADPDLVRGRHILLVDDILTTGATARACAHILIEAGAISVRVATVARAQRRVPRAFTDDRTYLNQPSRTSFVAAKTRPETSETHPLTDRKQASKAT